MCHHFAVVKLDGKVVAQNEVARSFCAGWKSCSSFEIQGKYPAHEVMNCTDSKYYHITLYYHTAGQSMCRPMVEVALSSNTLAQHSIAAVHACNKPCRARGSWYESQFTIDCYACLWKAEDKSNVELLATGVANTASACARRTPSCTVVDEWTLLVR